MLIDDPAHHADPTRMRFTAHALQALRLLDAQGYRIVVVADHAGVAPGCFDLEALHRLRRALARRLARAHVTLAGLHACPHEGPGTGPPCGCRRPAPGLLELAARMHGLDLAHSWTVGDTLDDVEAGRRAGCRTVLLDAGHGTQGRAGPLRTPDGRAADLHGSAMFILASAPASAPS